MIANFINLCKGSPEDVITGASIRKGINICGEVNGVVITETDFEGNSVNETMWLISVAIDDIPHPKIHFRAADKDKAMKLYDFLIERYTMNAHIVELDVLEWGAV